MTTVSSRSCLCWLYRASPSLAAKNIINLISVLTIWWCPYVESCVVGRGYLPRPVRSLGKTYFGSVSSFFLELFLHWCPVAYWTPPDLGSSSFIVLSFCLFILYSLGSGVDCIQVPIQPYISSAVSYLDFPCFSFLSCRMETHSSLFVFFFHICMYSLLSSNEGLHVDYFSQCWK